MDKKLPKVFANDSLGNLHNNKKVFYSNQERGVEEPASSKETTIIGRNVEEKIRSIFNSTNYIYKANVDITLNGGVVQKKIIGKNRDNLITMDNELIPISSIIDIQYSK